MLGQQEASPHLRYVKGVLDPDFVPLAFVVGNVKREGSFILDC
jgi:hypothetical protein